MRKFFIFFITFSSFLFIICFHAEKDCTKFKTGKYIFKQQINGQEHITQFVRTNDYQIETYQGKTDTASIRWVNNCEFILQKLHPKNMSEKKSIQMKIISTDEKGYMVEYGFVGNPKKQKGRIDIAN